MFTNHPKELQLLSMLIHGGGGGEGVRVEGEVESSVCLQGKSFLSW